MELADELIERVMEYHAVHRVEIPSLDPQSSSALDAAGRVMQADTIELESLVRRDPAISAGVLKAASSPVYRASSKSMQLQDIIVRLGRKEIYAVVATVAVRSLLRPAMRDIYNLFPEAWHELHHHCVTCAFTTAWLADREKWVPYDQGFLAGMFHDIGKILALNVLGRLVVAKILDKPTYEPLFPKVLERTHVRLGSDFLRAGNMPDYLQEVCEKHHAAVPADTDIHKLSHGVGVVSSLDDLQAKRIFAENAASHLAAGQRALGLTDEALRAIRGKLADMSGHAATLVSV